MMVFSRMLTRRVRHGNETPSGDGEDDHTLLLQTREEGGDNMNELKWEGRLWALFQIGLVALVGYLVLQAVETQTLLAKMVTEHQFTNRRLDKIEEKLERSMDSNYTQADARHDWDAASHRFSNIEDRLNAQAEAIQDLRRKVR